MGALTPTSILAGLRAYGARIRIAGDRVHVEGVRRGDLPAELVVAARHHRDDLLDELHREAERLVIARTAAEWRARFERLAAEQMFVEGYEQTAARRRAFYEVLVDWVAKHPDVDVLPNSQAEPIAVMALAEIGIFERKEP